MTKPTFEFNNIQQLATWSDLARNAKRFGDVLAAGDPILIMRNSKPIGIFVPIDSVHAVINIYLGDDEQ